VTRLADIKARLAVASPGPWQRDDDLAYEDDQARADGVLVEHAREYLAYLLRIAEAADAMLDALDQPSDLTLDQIDAKIALRSALEAAE
jgi:hypothetical protein